MEPDTQDDGSWEAEQQRDMDALEKAALEALEASTKRALTRDEQMALAYAAGVANEHYKRITPHNSNQDRT